jgi:hypothetical protein
MISSYTRFAIDPLLLAGPVRPQELRARGQNGLRCPSQTYLDLLTKFPEDRQGEGLEPLWPGIAHQPMTYGLVLSSEVLHYHSCPNEASRRRIRLAVQWLLDNADLDEDGLPGWGLPMAWDAFGDGTVNPENQPYTVTTAVVLEGLLDALSIPFFWTDAERSSVRTLLVQASLRWCQDVWTQDAFGGFFWYSPNHNDAHFVLNSAAMFLGSAQRTLFEQGDAFSDAERQFVQSRVDEAARGIISQVTWRDGAPFWIYASIPLQSARPNDLVHHAYILWGMENYRSFGGQVTIPWSSQQASESLTRFWKDGVIHEWPQDVTYESDLYQQPARLWGVGMMLAFESRWGDPLRASQYLDAIVDAYGPMPDLRLWPAEYSQDETFYARFAVHVLWGIAIRDFLSVYKVYLPFLAVSPAPAGSPSR